MPKDSPLLSKLDTVMSLVLFGLSAILSFLLFTESAGGRLLYEIVFGLMALCFDSTKVILWIRGARERNGVFILLALLLVAVSLFAASGSALAIATSGSGGDSDLEARLSQAKAVSASAQADADVWRSRLMAVPADFTSQLKIVGAQLEKAQDRLAQSQAKEDALRQEALAKENHASSMFSLIAGKLKVEATSIKLGFLLAVIVLLEACALATSYKGQRTGVQALAYAQDAQGTTHVLRGQRAMCGKPQVTPVEKPTRLMCSVCISQHLKEAQR